MIVAAVGVDCMGEEAMIAQSSEGLLVVTVTVNDDVEEVVTRLEVIVEPT